MTSAASIAEQINALTWVKIGRWIQAPLFAWSNITGRTRESNQTTLGFDYEFRHFLFLDWKYQFESGEFEIMKTFFEEKLAANKEWFRDYERIVSKVSNDMIDYSKPFIGKEFSSFSDDELADVFRGFYRTVNLAQPVLEGYQLLGELLEIRVRRELQRYFERTDKDPSLADEYIKYLNIPKKKIAMVEEDEDFLRFVAQMQKNGWTTDSAEVRQLMDAHLEKYRWISTHHFIGDPFDESYFWNRIPELMKIDCSAELKRRAELASSHRETCRQYQEELQDEQDLLLYVDIAQDLAYLKPFRVDAYYIAWTNLWGLFTEIGSRLDIRIDELMCLTDTEIDAAITSGGVDRKVIAERKQDFAVMKLNGELEMVSGERLAEIKAGLETVDYSQITEVKGVMAHKGHVKGRATVLHSEDDIPKVKEGDIMIISMTDPNYVPAMKKAAAFVTDFGGILCHAAIVSREMGTPCVIGTDIATKVFRSGEMVEVDADRGVVRKI